MALDIPRQQYTGVIKQQTIGDGEYRIVIGGETALPFYLFEGLMPNQPRIAIQVVDYEPEDWPEAVKEPYRDVMADPAAWARKAQDVYGADMVHLWLKSADPNGLNRPIEEVAATVKKVAAAVRVPLIVWGTLNVECDAKLLKAVAETCPRKDIVIGPVQEGNYKQLGAVALGFGMRIVASSPIDINLAKQLNILLTNLGVPLENIIIDPTTGGLGYGLEYTYSVMERIRQAALMQNDEKLQCPFLCNLADEVWKTKEVKQPSDAIMGSAAERGILMEAVTAVTLLLAGADILVMRHPQAIAQVRRYIATLGGFEVPKTTDARPVHANERHTAAGETLISPSRVASSLKEGALCKIVQIMDMPVELAPGYAIALIKSIDPEEADEGIVLGPRRGQSLQEQAEKERETAGYSGKAASSPVQPEFRPAREWEPLEDGIGNYDYQHAAKKDFAGKEVKVINESYEPGIPHHKHDWRGISVERQEKLSQIKTGLRYWYGEGYGSEKRKKPA